MFKVYKMADTRINTARAQRDGLVAPPTRRRPNATRPDKRVGIDLNDISTITEYDTGTETLDGVVVLEMKNGRSYYIESNFDEITDAMQKARKSIYT